MRDIDGLSEKLRALHDAILHSRVTNPDVILDGVDALQSMKAEVEGSADVISELLEGAKLDYGHATRFLLALWPEAKLHSTTRGVIDQIDNCIVGLRSSLRNEVIAEIADDFERSADIHPEWTADEVADRIRSLSNALPGEKVG